MTSKIKEKSLVMLGEEALRLDRVMPRPNNQRTPSFPLIFPGLLLLVKVLSFVILAMNLDFCCVDSFVFI